MWNLEAYSFWPNSQYFREQSHLEIQLWFSLKLLISSTAIRTLLTSQVHLMFPHLVPLPSLCVFFTPPNSNLLLFADLLLNPRDPCWQWGDRFLSGKGKKKSIFQHQIKFSQHQPLHPQLLCPTLCVNHQFLQVEGHLAGLLGKPWSGNQTLFPYQTSLITCLALRSRGDAWQCGRSMRWDFLMLIMLHLPLEIKQGLSYTAASQDVQFWAGTEHGYWLGEFRAAHCKWGALVAITTWSLPADKSFHICSPSHPSWVV